MAMKRGIPQRATWVKARSRHGARNLGKGGRAIAAAPVERKASTV